MMRGLRVPRPSAAFDVRALRVRAARWRAAADLILRECGRLGWIGLASLVLACVLADQAVRRADEAAGLQAQADELHARAARPSAPARTVAAPTSTTASQARAASLAVDRDAVTRALPRERNGADALPFEVLRDAERRGLVLGPVEYRWGRRGDGLRRLDVQLSVTGSYAAGRAWLSETLHAMPHAQIAELTITRGETQPDGSSGPVEIRATLALHFRTTA